jgi:hypothetical protein
MNSTHGREFQRSAVVNANTAMVHSRSEDVISPRKSDNSDNRNEHEGGANSESSKYKYLHLCGRNFLFSIFFFQTTKW